MSRLVFEEVKHLLMFDMVPWCCTFHIRYRDKHSIKFSAVKTVVSHMYVCMYVFKNPSLKAECDIRSILSAVCIQRILSLRLIANTVYPTIYP